MFQILRNILSNAIKYSYTNSEILVSFSNRGQYTEISITDFGVGISTDVKNKLFKVAENTSIPGTNNEKGTGLGLIIVDDFVKKHKGKIDVEGEPGNGSTFTISFPKTTTSGPFL